MNTYISLSSLAMDLDRISIGLYRGSDAMAERFVEEALARKKEIDLKTVKPYIRKLLKKMEESFRSDDRERKAEDALMFSTLFQNASLQLKKSLV